MRYEKIIQSLTRIRNYTRATIIMLEFNLKSVFHRKKKLYARTIIKITDLLHFSHLQKCIQILKTNYACVIANFFQNNEQRDNKRSKIYCIKNIIIHKNGSMYSRLCDR